MLAIAIWSLTSLLMLTGLVGVVVPLLPGTTLILIGVIIHKLVLPLDVSWLTIGFIAVFWAFSIIADILGTVLGTRWFGGTKWGMAGAGGGALVGVFISLPALILGTVLGAVAAEKLFAKRTGGESLRAGLGAATGFVLSTIARLGCAIVMIALFLVAALSTQ
jgi:uncharacterized protein YqgC (DUF456 family)